MNHSIKAQILIFFFLLILIVNEGAIECKSSQMYVEPSNTDLSEINGRNPNLKTSKLPAAYCTGNFSDMGEDLDGDLFYDHVVLSIEINVTQYIPNFAIHLFIQPLKPNENATIIGNYLEVSRIYTWMEIGIHNVSIPIINASIFHALGQDLKFYIQEISIKRYYNSYLYSIEIYHAFNLYTTRVYLKENFDQYIRFTGQIWDRCEDTDNNWRYDYLIIEIEVEVLQKNVYLVKMELTSEARKSEESLTSFNRSSYDLGINIISIWFNATSLRGLQINGSLVVTNIEFYDETNTMVYQVSPNYVTQVYTNTDFDIHLIKINGNEEFSEFVNSEKLKGDGSPLNPYIITGVISTESTIQYYISIKNVNVFFQISNNIIQGGKTAIFLQNLTHCLVTNNNILDNQVGICLENVNESIIRHNTITGHIEGIFLNYTNGNLIDCNSLNYNNYGIKINRSCNNIIANNSISGRKEYTNDFGILIGINSSDNLITRNDFQDNNFNVYDSGLNNCYQFNYWDNWSGEGYFWIPGELNNTPSFDNYDYSPSKIPNHLGRPIIISPLSGTYLDPIIIIKWEAYDSLGLILTYNIYFSTNNRIGDYNWTLLTTGITQNQFEWDVRNVTEGYYQIKIVVFDSLGFSSYDVSDWFIIQAPVNPTPIINSLLGMIILILVCVGLLIKSK